LGGDRDLIRTDEPQLLHLYRRELTPRRAQTVTARPATYYGPGVAVHTTEVRLETRGDADIVDLSRAVAEAVAVSGVSNGQASAFVRGSTAGITTMELEPGGVHDLHALLDRLIPAGGDYEHNRLNRDTNSHAHQRASLIGPSEVVPVTGGRLALGTWQQLVLIDFDDRPRQRTVVIQVIG
jgi:secondary thiamine-phosphate synthase enzyme